LSADRTDWDAHAGTFDEEPDHGLRDPVVRGAWSALLAQVLPAAPAAVVDIGCGTGTLSVLLAEGGHRPCGLDASAAMLAVARAKAAAHGVAVPLVRGDATRPPFGAGSFDVVLVRHVLWAVADPDATLARWFALLRPGGRLVLIEGRWSTGAGLPAAACAALVRRHRNTIQLRPLDDGRLWGRTVIDERYLIVS
jgi:ubiquinone/menaquinone biosynthesis C-methylase UbiE